MNPLLTNKVAIVTGGASGIGRASAELFASQGAKVVIADISDEAGEQLAAELGDSAHYRHTDVGKPAEIQRLIDETIDHFGGLHIMFNNAGLPTKLFSNFLDDSLDDFQQVIDVNLKAVMVGTQRAGRHMAKHGGGSIINTASLGGTVAGYGVVTYRAAKAAVLHFTKCAAIDLAQHNIRVNAINPGHIRTKMSSWDQSGMSQQGFEQLQKDLDAINFADQPLKRYGTPEDVANAALYLASDLSAQVTGMVVPVDGGVAAGDAVNHVALIEAAQSKAMGQ